MSTRDRFDEMARGFVGDGEHSYGAGCGGVRDNESSECYGCRRVDAIAVALRAAVAAELKRCVEIVDAHVMACNAQRAPELERRADLVGELARTARHMHTEVMNIAAAIRAPRNPHLGSKFSSLLDELGIRESVEKAAREVAPAPAQPTKPGATTPTAQQKQRPSIPIDRLANSRALRVGEVIYTYLGDTIVGPPVGDDVVW